MGTSYEKMRKLHFVCLVVIGFVAVNLHSVHCCKDRRSRRHQKEVSTHNGKEKRSLVLLPYENVGNLDCDSYEADNENTLISDDYAGGIKVEKSRKIKLNSPDYQNVRKNVDKGDSKNATNDTVPHNLIATVVDQNDEIETLFGSRKTKRNPLDKTRHTRDKKFMCLCEETKCSTKDCLANKLSPSNSREDEDTSAEELDDVIQNQSSEPKKISIPFAHNVNFDQRVIVGAEKSKPSANTFYPVYANPQVYHYSPYNMAQPGMIYTAVTPTQQNYAPGVAYNKFLNPSLIPANLLKSWQNQLSFDNNPKNPGQYVPHYSSENAKKESESNKITTPRQVDNKLYPLKNPSQSTGNIEDLRSTYSYSTDFPYKQHYTTGKVSVDLLKHITENPKQHQFKDSSNNNQKVDAKYPANYANNIPSLSPDAGYSPISTLPPNVNNEHQPHEDSYRVPAKNELSIKVDKVMNDYINDVPTMRVPNDDDLGAFSPPQKASKPLNKRPLGRTTKAPTSHNTKNGNPPRVGQGNTEVSKNPAQRVTTLEDVNNDYSSHYNPQKTASLRNANDFSMENLFKGLKNLILNDVSVSDTPKIQAIDVSVSDTPQIQAIDERPSTTYENTYRNPENVLVQNAVKRVLNNFVPGKSEDLLANYNTERSEDFTHENAESLSLDLTSSHALKNLLHVPEVENMIVDATCNLVNQLTGSSISKIVIKDTLHKVVKEIPRPTSAPSKRSPLKFQIRMAKRVPRYDESSVNEEVFDKIKSIINKSKLGEEAATHPLAKNLIVKAVKHSIDKEKGAVDEGAIRRAFNELVKSRTISDNYHTASGHGSSIVQPKNMMDNSNNQKENVYTTENTEYKVAAKFPVTERRLQNGVWVEAPTVITGSRGPETILEEKKRKELEKHLDMLEQYNKPDVTEARGSLYYTTGMPQKSDSFTKEAIPHFYDGVGVTPDPANNQYYQQNNGYNEHANNPLVTTISYDYHGNPTSYPTTQQPNQVNLLVESSQSTTDQGQYSHATEDPIYMGKLVPVNSVNGELDNSDLVWVGDGVRLPLAMRKMHDGSFTLTLSDEVCKKFQHKKCPCCLPDAGRGVIVREMRSDEVDYADDLRSRVSFDNGNEGNYRIRRDSGEETIFKTFSNTIGEDDFDNADYEDSVESNYPQQRGAPYKYQRYANEDKFISGRTRAIGNMLKWVKDVVTEAHEKRQKRLVGDAPKQKHKVALS